MQVTLPPPIALLTRGFEWEKDEMGLSGNAVYQLTKGKETRYLKTATPDAIIALQAESDRIQWLGPYLPVPEVLAFEVDEQGAYLLMRAIGGKIACDAVFYDRVPQVVEALGAGLRQFHAVSIAECPFDKRRTVQIEEARRRMVSGQIDLDDLEDQWQGRSSRWLYDELINSQPADEDLVLTHGDFCLPNMLIDPATMQVTGFIDLGRVGVSDRYTDLALTARSLAMNWGKAYVPLLFEAYGVRPDADKLHFYTLLDEFF